MKTTKRLAPVHPGDILSHDFMEPLELSATRLAKALGVAVPTVNEIVRSNKSVTAEMALRLSRYFGTTPDFWVKLQSQFDLEVARSRIAAKLRAIAPRDSAAP